MTSLRGHWRSRTAQVAALLVVAVYLATVFADVSLWRFEWDWGLLAIGIADVAVMPILIGAACLEAVIADGRLSGMIEGRRQRLRAVWPSTVVLSVYGLAAWAAAELVAVVFLVSSDAVGGIRWAGLATHVVATPGAVALGSILGTVVPRAWAPPVAGATAVGAIMAWPLLGLLPEAPATFIVGYDLPPTAAAASVFWLSLLAIAAPIGGSSARRFVVVRLSLAAAAAAAGFVGLRIDPYYESRVEVPTACSDTAVSAYSARVCAPEHYAGSLALVGREVDAVAGIVLGLDVDPPARINLYSYSSGAPGGPGEVSVGVHAAMLSEAWVPRPGEFTLAGEVLQAFAYGSCGWMWGDEPSHEVFSLAHFWLAQQVGLLSEVGGAFDEAWARMSAADQERSVGRLIRGAYECDDSVGEEVARELEEVHGVDVG